MARVRIYKQAGKSPDHARNVSHVMIMLLKGKNFPTNKGIRMKGYGGDNKEKQMRCCNGLVSIGSERGNKS